MGRTGADSAQMEWHPAVGTRRIGDLCVVPFVAHTDLQYWAFGENFNFGLPFYRVVGGNAILSRWPIEPVGNPFCKNAIEESESLQGFGRKSMSNGFDCRQPLVRQLAAASSVTQITRSQNSR